MEKLASKTNNKKFFNILFAKKFDMQNMESFCIDKPDTTFMLSGDIYANISEAKIDDLHERTMNRVEQMIEFYKKHGGYAVVGFVHKNHIKLTLMD